MTKVSIIDVNLGMKVEDIISENVVTLTGKARQELDTAIEERKQVERVKNEKAEAKKTEDDQISTAMQEAYDKIVECGDDGLPVDDVMAIVGHVIPNTSAFTLRMKKILRDAGNPYQVSRKKRNKKPVYIFEPFNEETNS